MISMTIRCIDVTYCAVDNIFMGAKMNNIDNQYAKLIESTIQKIKTMVEKKSVDV